MNEASGLGHFSLHEPRHDRECSHHLGAVYSDYERVAYEHSRLKESAGM